MAQNKTRCSVGPSLCTKEYLLCRWNCLVPAHWRRAIIIKYHKVNQFKIVQKTLTKIIFKSNPSLHGRVLVWLSASLRYLYSSFLNNIIMSKTLLFHGIQFLRVEVFLLVFTAHLVYQVVSKVYIDGSKALKRDAGDGVAYANFAAHKFRSLNLASLDVALVKEPRECGKLCVDHSSCFSTNLAGFRDQDGKIMCELLPSDKYNNSDKFVENSTFHHLSIKVSKPPLKYSPKVFISIYID